MTNDESKDRFNKGHGNDEAEEEDVEGHSFNKGHDKFNEGHGKLNEGHGKFTKDEGRLH
ncbi:MAG: hypothetical protein ACRDFS_07330 [Chloroflexota bacterium]